MVKSGVTSSLSINFFLAAFLNISMKRIWGIIQFLQIVTHMPFLMPILPTNYQVVLKLVYDVARLQIIPTQYIYMVARWFNIQVKNNIESGGSLDKNNFFIENMGSIILCLSVALILLIIIIILKHLAARNKS
jgi:hypothetical protein